MQKYKKISSPVTSDSVFSLHGNGFNASLIRISSTGENGRKSSLICKSISQNISQVTDADGIFRSGGEMFTPFRGIAETVTREPEISICTVY